jgi:hypothetical protein
MQKGCEHPLSDKLSIVSQWLKCIMGVMWVIQAPLMNIWDWSSLTHFKTHVA